jgi:hypothetical protein
MAEDYRMVITSAACQVSEELPVRVNWRSESARSSGSQDL